MLQAGNVLGSFMRQRRALCTSRRHPLCVIYGMAQGDLKPQTPPIRASGNLPFQTQDRLAGTTQLRPARLAA